MKVKPSPRPRARPAGAKPDPRREAGAARRTPRGELRRQALLDAARDVFLEQGYEGASIEEIVRRVGGSKASLYSYFGSKEGLFWDVLAALSDHFMKELGIPTCADQDVEATLTAIGKRFLRMFLDPAGRRLSRTMIAESERFPELARRFFERGPQRARRMLGAYLALQHDAGRLECPQPEQAAAHFLELVKGPPHVRVLLSMPPFPPEQDPAQHVGSAVQLFLYGCARRPGAPRRKP